MGDKGQHGVRGEDVLLDLNMMKPVPRDAVFYAFDTNSLVIALTLVLLGFEMLLYDYVSTRCSLLHV